MDEVPDLLYHYANFGGLTGILQSRRLWATDIRYLNDANELSYGVSEMSELVEKIASEMPDLTGEDLVKYGTLNRPGECKLDHNNPDALGPAHRAVYAAAMSLAALVDRSKPQMPMEWKWANGYVTCFTSKPDSLGQWRGYAGGDGFAIGFRRECLEELTVPCWDYRNGDVDRLSDKWFEIPVSPPQRVQYGNEKREISLSDAEEALRYFISSAEAIVPYVKFSISVFTAALRICMTMKDEAFKEEAEWRLIAMQPYSAKLNFRPGGYGNGGIVPYTEITYPTDAVQRIVIGPGNSPELRERAVRQMLETYGFGINRVEVVHSKVPFRD